MAAENWKHLLKLGTCWQETEGKIFHELYQPVTDLLADSSWIQKLLVAKIWAAQKNSRVVRENLSALLRRLDDGGWGMNIGAGHTRLHPRMINVDVFPGENIDIVNVGTKLPIQDESIDLVVSQEVLEHVDSPDEYIAEAHRVLRPGGLFYCQLPFVIGYHPGPTDYWRFTKEGMVALFAKQSWKLKAITPTLGQGSSLYRILVEFLAVTASGIHGQLYKPVKGLGSVFCYPLQFFDIVKPHPDCVDRIPGGYFCIAEKQD